MAKSKLNLFGSDVSSSNNNQEINTMTQVINNNNSTVIANQETKNMNTLQTAFENARQYDRAPKTHTAYVHITEAEANAASPRHIFEQLITSGRIGISRAANATRQQGIAAIFRNKTQMKQLARALMMHEYKIYSVSSVQIGETWYITLKDNFGDQDRVVVASKGGDGKVYYRTHYATKQYNDRGEFGLSLGEVHPIGISIQKDVAGYNGWVDMFNMAVKAIAMGNATPEQIKLTKGLALGTQDPNRFVQENTVTHINADGVVDKYQLLAWLDMGMTHPAFEIFTRAKSNETWMTFFDGMVEQMTKSYRGELKKFSGLYSTETDQV